MSDTTPVFCDDCQAAVRIERTDDYTLTATCACGESREVEMPTHTPATWLDG